MSNSHYDIRVPSLPQIPFDHRDWDEFHESAALFDDGRLQPASLQIVRAWSPIGMRRAVFKIAQFFRREFSYDFTQYGYDGKDDDPQHVAFLWTADGMSRSDVAIGGGCFRWREWQDAPHGWGLQWVWIHPYERRKGLLRAAWPYFRLRFGDFFPERPLSEAMESFLKAVIDKPPEILA